MWRFWFFFTREQLLRTNTVLYFVHINWWISYWAKLKCTYHQLMNFPIRANYTVIGTALCNLWVWLVVFVLCTTFLSVLFGLAVGIATVFLHSFEYQPLTRLMFPESLNAPVGCSLYWELGCLSVAIPWDGYIFLAWPQFLPEPCFDGHVDDCTP
jgi:hypothetical protein